MNMADIKVVQREHPATVQAPATETAYVPLVDIRENSERVVLVADMPGVDPKSVELKVENDVLTIEGQALADCPPGCKLVGQEYGVGKYRRDFALSRELDASAVKARMQHGTLEVTIPKREETKMRKIAIES
jgi:HSP20 family protein